MLKAKNVLEINKSLKRYSTYGPLLLSNGSEPSQESFDKLTARLREENIQDRVRAAVTEARSNPGEIKLRQPKIRKQMSEDDTKYMETKSLDSIGGDHLTDVESIMTLEEPSETKPKQNNDEMKDSGTESAASPTLNDMSKVKPPSQKVYFSIY